MAERRPRLVVLSDFATIGGGAARVAVASACGLAARGWRVTLVCAVGPIAAELAEAGVDVRHLGASDVWSEPSRLRAARNGIWNAALAARLGAILEEGRPEATIVHAHQWTKALSPSCLAAARRFGAPLVVSLHDYFAACPNGLLFDFGAARRCPRVPLSAGCVMAGCDRDGRLHKAVRVARQIVTRRVWREPGSLTFVHVSRFARERAGALLPPGAAQAVVANPCFVERGPPVEVGANHALALVGRLTVEKGVPWLIEALRDSDAQLLALGDGPMRETLERALPGRVTLLPWGADDAVLEVLGRARALVYPSIWDETGGLVACEALARGVPVIAADRTAGAEHVRATGGGIVVPPHDVAALRAAIAAMATGDSAARLGALGHRGYWQAPMTLRRHVDELARLYGRLLGIGPHPRVKVADCVG